MNGQGLPHGFRVVSGLRGKAHYARDMETWALCGVGRNGGITWNGGKTEVDCKRCLTLAAKASIKAEEEPVASVAEMMAELDAIAAQRGIAFDDASESATTDTSQRTRYARPGQRCGNGVVRKVSEAQRRFMLSLLEQRDTSNLVRLPGSEDVRNMSLAGARDLIDRLLACPIRADAPVRMATERQRESVAREARRRVISDDMVSDVTERFFAGDAITFDEASYCLDHLFSAPFLPRESTKVDLMAGIYYVDGEVFKVQISAAGHAYAKHLIDGSFTYEAGAVRKIKPEHMMTLDQAREYGRMYGVCCECGKLLTNEVSVTEGIGPICSGRISARFGDVPVTVEPVTVEPVTVEPVTVEPVTVEPVSAGVTPVVSYPRTSRSVTTKPATVQAAIRKPGNRFKGSKRNGKRHASFR